MVPSYLNKSFRESAPYLLVSLLFLILFTSGFWYLYDGSVFHLQNFLIGSLNNPEDYARIGSVILTDILDLAYINLGGDSFFISRQFFVFGHTVHIFFPLLFLSFVARKDPEKAPWAYRSMWIYVLSLFIIRGFGLFFLVTEIFEAHTLTWLAIFSYQAGNQFRKLHLFFAFYSVFTYPHALFSNGFIFLRELWRSKRISVFHLVLILITIALHIHYISKQSGVDKFLEVAFDVFHDNRTVHFYLVSLLLMFGLKKIFKYQFWIMAAVGVAYYVLKPAFGFWHFVSGRTFGLLIVIIMQALCVFVPLAQQEKYFENSKQRIQAFVMMALLVISFQWMTFEAWDKLLYSVLETQKGTISYAKSQGLIYPYWYLNRHNARMQTLSMMLMKSDHVTTLINPRENDGTDAICLWGPELFRKLMKEKHLTLNENLDLGCNFPRAK